MLDLSQVQTQPNGDEDPTELLYHRLRSPQDRKLASPRNQVLSKAFLVLNLS